MTLAWNPKTNTCPVKVGRKSRTQGENHLIKSWEERSFSDPTSTKNMFLGYRTSRQIQSTLHSLAEEEKAAPHPHFPTPLRQDCGHISNG